MAQADLPVCDSFWSPREILSSGISSSPHKTCTAQPALISQLPILSAGDTGRPCPSAPPTQEPSLRLQAEAGSHEDLCSGSKASGRNIMLPAPRNTADAKLLSHQNPGPLGHSVGPPHSDPPGCSVHNPVKANAQASIYKQTYLQRRLFTLISNLEQK